MARTLTDPIADETHWDLRVLVALVPTRRRPSREGMNRTWRRPLFSGWVESGPDVIEAEHAVRTRDLERLGTVMDTP